MLGWRWKNRKVSLKGIRIFVLLTKHFLWGPWKFVSIELLTIFLRWSHLNRLFCLIVFRTKKNTFINLILLKCERLWVYVLVCMLLNCVKAAGNRDELEQGYLIILLIMWSEAKTKGNHNLDNNKLNSPSIQYHTNKKRLDFAYQEQK